MSDTNGQAWGMCAAFSCPLFGTLGSDGAWYCFCHAGKPSVFNDAITRELRDKLGAVVNMTLAIRRDTLGSEWSSEAAAAVKALKAHPMGGELAFNRSKDMSARAWLQRLERHLIEATVDIGQQKRISTAAPTAKVIGPTHAMQHYTDPKEAA